jgi:polar amino acid transport system permease protein
MSSLWLVSTTSFFNFSFLPKYTIYFAQGILYTLLLSIVAVALAVLPALGLALMRLSKNKVLKTLSGAYIALFRSTPLLVQLALIYYGLFGVAGIQLPSFYVLGYINLAQFIPGAVALALNSSAYVAEIFRGGILSVDKGQMEAARSLGLTQWQGMRFVVLPQAIKNILPSLANEVITMVKESSICSVIGMMELMWGAKTVATTTYVTLGPYVLAAVIYFCINFPASKAIEAVERRMRRGDNQ